jgi:hypothetical protein
MAITKKPLTLGALALERGLTIGDTAWAFGGSTILTLGAGNAFPFYEISGSAKSDLKDDDSIEGVAFKSLPVQSGLKAETSLGIDWRYLGMDALLYWMFGYEDGGSSPVNRTGGIYSHLFELDSHERELAPYRTSEQTAGSYAATDRKNRYAMIAKKLGTQDHRWPFSLCKSFSFQSSAGSQLKATMKAQALREDRGSYNSGAWTIPAGVSGTDNEAMHHHLNFSIGVAGALVDLAITDLNITCDIPLTVEQDSESGLYISEPVLNGKYDLKVSFTIARHSVDTYLAYRDSFTELAASAIWTKGTYEMGLYFPSLKMANANVSDDEIARQPVELVLGNMTGSNPFTSLISTHALKQNGPMFCMTKDTNSTNEMRRL